MKKNFARKVKRIKAGNVTARYELHTGVGASGEIVKFMENNNK